MKEIEFKSTFLKELRAKAVPLDCQLLEEIQVEQQENMKNGVKPAKETFLSKYDTSSLKVEID